MASYIYNSKARKEGRAKDVQAAKVRQGKGKPSKPAVTLKWRCPTCGHQGKPKTTKKKY